MPPASPFAREPALAEKAAHVATEEASINGISGPMVNVCLEARRGRIDVWISPDAAIGLEGTFEEL